MKKKELEAKVREQEIEIAGLKAKLDLMMKLSERPAVQPIIYPSAAPVPSMNPPSWPPFIKTIEIRDPMPGEMPQIICEAAPAIWPRHMNLEHPNFRTMS